MRTRLRTAIRSPLAPIEFCNEHQPTMVCCIQMTRKLSDLSCKIIDGEINADDLWRCDVSGAMCEDRTFEVPTAHSVAIR
jgi:hypothetical protein